MSRCQCVMYIEGNIRKFTCHEAKKHSDEWKRQFRKDNHTDDIIKYGLTDASYDRFCKHIDDFIAQCKCKDDMKSEDYYQCKKCDEKDQIHGFCCCEDRNIRISRERRENGESPWNKFSNEEMFSILVRPFEIAISPESPLPEKPFEVVGDGYFETVAIDGKIVVRPKWISVEDRLPEDDQDVLVYHAEDFHITVGYFKSKNVQYYLESDGSKFYTDSGWETEISWAPKGKVTHWMPLPQPPEGKYV